MLRRSGSSPPPSSAEPSLIGPQPVLECDWIDSERWVWEELIAGRIADFNARRGVLDVGDCEGWDVERELRPGFLERLLLLDPHRSALPASGIRVIGAWIRGALDLDGYRFIRGFRIERSRIEGDVFLRRVRSTDDLSFRGSFVGASCELPDARIDGTLDFSETRIVGRLNLSRVELADHIRFIHASCGEITLEAAKVAGGAYLQQLRCRRLVMNNVRVGGALYMNDAKLAGVELKRSTISGHADLQSVRSTGLLDLEGVDVGSDVFLAQAKLTALAMTGARILGQLTLRGIVCTGKVDLEGVNVRDDLVLRKGRFQGLNMNGAICGGQLIMNDVKVGRNVNMQALQIGVDLWMRRAKVLKDMHLQGSRIGANLEMDGARFSEKLTLSHITIGLNLRMTNVNCGGAVDMEGARISGEAELTNSALRNDLSMASAVVGLGLSMAGVQGFGTFRLNRVRCGAIDLTKSRLTTVEMRSAIVQGHLNLDGARISKSLDLELSKVEGNVFLRDGADFGVVTLLDAEILGSIIARRASFGEKFDLCGVRANYIWLHHGAQFGGKVDLTHARIAQNIEVTGAHFDGDFDVTSAHIGSTLSFDSEKSPQMWGPNSQLILRDASTKSFRFLHVEQLSSEPSKPPRLRLGGLTYERLGKAAEADSPRSTASDRRQLIRWLAKDVDYSPQPYHQLASVLRSQGYPQEADRILFAGRDRQRRESAGFRRLLDDAFRVTIGYGYRYYYSVFWVLLVTLVGGFVFAPAVHTHWTEPGAPWLFSLAQLLPVIDFSPGADDIAKGLQGAARWYLALHRACGFLLGSFVIAGLSGITKK